MTALAVLLPDSSVRELPSRCVRQRVGLALEAA